MCEHNLLLQRKTDNKHKIIQKVEKSQADDQKFTTFITEGKSNKFIEAKNTRDTKTGALDL